MIRLSEPWSVRLGDRQERVRWIGVRTAPPHRGLLYLDTKEPPPGQPWPDWEAALYTTTAVPPPVPSH